MEKAGKIGLAYHGISGTGYQVAAARMRSVDALAETIPQYLLSDEIVFGGKNPQKAII